MSKLSVSLPLILGALVVASAPALAQSTDKASANTPNASIAGKASAAKATPTKATAERKKYEFTAAKTATPAAAATLAPADGTAHSSTPAAAKDKAGCHSRGSDA